MLLRAGYKMYLGTFTLGASGMAIFAIMIMKAIEFAPVPLYLSNP